MELFGTRVAPLVRAELGSGSAALAAPASA